MYLCTVFRSSPTWRAIADTLKPCRCNSRIITTSPSPTNDAPPAWKAVIIRPPPTARRRPPSTHLGKIQSAHLGIIPSALTAETLLPLLAPESEAAVEVAQDALATFACGFEAADLDGLRGKIGLETRQ